MAAARSPESITNSPPEPRKIIPFLGQNTPNNIIGFQQTDSAEAKPRSGQPEVKITEEQRKAALNVAVDNARRYAEIAKTVKKAENPKGLQVDMARKTLEFRLGEASLRNNPELVESALKEFRSNMQFSREEQDVLSAISSQENRLAVATEAELRSPGSQKQQPEVDPAELDATLSQLEKAKIITGNPSQETKNAAAQAINAAKQVEGTIANSKKSLNIFAKIKQSIVVRWVKLKFKVQKAIGIEKSKTQAYKEAMEAGFSEEQAQEISQDYIDEYNYEPDKEEKEAEEPAVAETKVAETAPKPAEKIEAEVEQPVEPVVVKETLKPTLAERLAAKTTAQEVAKPAIPENVDIDKLTILELHGLMRNVSTKLERAKIEALIEGREKELGKVAVSARVEQANYDILSEIVTDALFDPGNFAQIGHTSITEEGRKILMGEVQEADMDKPVEPTAVRQKVESVYARYFGNTEEKFREVLFNGTAEIPKDASFALRRAKTEMLATAGMLETRNERMQILMRKYFGSIGGIPAEEAETMDLQKLGEQADNHLQGMPKPEKDTLFIGAENAIKFELFKDIFSKRGLSLETIANHEELREILDHARIELTAAGPAVIVDDQSRLNRIFDSLNPGIREGKTAVIRGAVVRSEQYGEIIIAEERTTQQHEMGHLVNLALRSARQEAVMQLIMPELKAAGVEVSDLNGLSEAEFSAKINEKIRQLGTGQENKNARNLLRVYANVGKTPLNEEVGAAIYNQSLYSRMTLAQIGIDPEKLQGQKEQIGDEIVVANMFTDMYNQVWDRLEKMRADKSVSYEDYKEYQDNFVNARTLLARSIMERGPMNLEEGMRYVDRLKRIYFPKLYPKDADGKPLIDIPSAKVELVDGKEVVTYSAAAENLRSLKADLAEGRIDMGTYNKKLLEYFGENTGKAEQYIHADGMIFSTGVTGGGYQDQAVDYLTKLSPLNLKKTRKDVTWSHAFGGTKAMIQEDSRGTAGFFLRGLWNFNDILGVTPYKMNEAYGAWAVKLLGKRTAGMFGFHDALGANPLEKGIPGGLGRLPIVKEWAKRYEAAHPGFTFQIPMHEKKYTDRITSPKMIDINAQIINSIQSKLVEVGKDNSRILIILEAMGGLKFEGQQHSLSLDAFLEADETRFNPEMMAMITPPMPTIPPALPAVDYARLRLKNDSINGIELWDTATGTPGKLMTDENHTPYLLKGQLSDNLLRDLKAVTLKGIEAADKTPLVDRFDEIGTAMMDFDIKSWNKGVVDPTRPGSGRHFTVKELIEQVSRIESNTKVGEDVNSAYDGFGTWPDMYVKIGTDSSRPPSINPADPEGIYFNIDDVKSFIEHLYKARALEVLETGVNGLTPKTQKDPTGKSIPGAFVEFKPAPGQDLSETEEIKLVNGEYISKVNDKNEVVKVGLHRYIKTIMVTVPDPADPTKTITVPKQQEVQEVVEYVYNKEKKIEKQSLQTGFKIPFPPVEGATQAELLDLIGKFDIDPVSNDRTNIAKDAALEKDLTGKLIEEINGEIANKRLALDFYFRFTQRQMQTQEFAEVAKIKKKAWNMLAISNRIARWTFFPGLILGLTVAPGLLLIFRPELVILLFFWDWIFSRFLNRSRDGWGARNGIAEETGQKLEGMRSIFEKGRTASTLTGDEVRMMRVYMGAIDKMWEDLMPSYDKVVKYKKNVTQQLSTDFNTLVPQIFKLP
jgi:hypothetical protein